MSVTDSQVTSSSSWESPLIVIPVVREPLVVGLILVGLGTTSTGTAAELAPPIVQARAQTNSGGIPDSVRAPDSDVAELRLVSGLSWDQLARLFGVSRRAVHFWVSGKPMTLANEERLYSLLSVFRKMDRGSAAENRALLFGFSERGETPFELLVRGEFDRALFLIGMGTAMRRKPLAPLPTAESKKRAPPPPERLADAMHARVHVDKGRLVAATPIRSRRAK
jgi:DNA-binding transcriptional regulator YiaG